MSKTTTPSQKQSTTFLSMLFLVCAMLVGGTNLNAQEVKEELKPLAISDVRPVPPVVAVSQQSNAVTPAAEKNKLGFYDNGYIRYALTGDADKDAELYRIKKEELWANHPDLYNKWMNEIFAPQENKNSPNRSNTKN